MKILHTADWHLGKRLDRYSRLPEQTEVLEEIQEIADNEEVDAVLIAGDLFDTFNPPTEAIDLFYRSLKKLAKDGERPVIAIAGNHDSPDRIQAPDPLARENGIFFCGLPNTQHQKIKLDSGLEILRTDEGFIEFLLPNSEEKLRLILTPYANEQRLKTYLGDEDAEEELRSVLQEHWRVLAGKYCDENGVNILMSHLFVMKKGEKPVEEPESERPIVHLGGAQAIYTENFPSGLQYVALGHLHGNRWIQEKPYPIVYSSSPLAYSFSEANQSKRVIIIEAEAGKKAKTKAIELKSGKPLIQIEAFGVADAIEQLKANQNAWVELNLITDSYLKTEERKKIHQTHNGIVKLIPRSKQKAMEREKNINHEGKSTSQLFIEYFEEKKGQKPSEEILNLFKEISSLKT